MQHYFLASDAEPDRDPATGHLSGSASTSVPTAPVRRVSVGGQDPETARRNYEDAYPGIRVNVTRAAEPFSFRWTSVGDDRVTLRSATMTGHVSGELPGLTDYVVSWFQSGGGRIERRDGRTTDIPHAPFLLPFEQRYAFNLTPHRQNSVHFSAAYLEDVATEVHGGARQTLSFDVGAAVSPDAILRWRAALAASTDVLVDVHAYPLMRMDAQRQLARALLDLFPWVPFDVPAVMREPSMVRTRLALEYLHHHAGEAVTTADAARAAGLHPRTLQHHLSRNLDMSPSAYLRGIRLDRTRSALTTLSPDETSVAEVARQWGFGHLGRFSAAYRKRFGELPNDTLRR